MEDQLITLELVLLAIAGVGGCVSHAFKQERK